MNYFISFNEDLFTNNIEDYSIETKSIDYQQNFFKAIFTSLNVPCVIRKIDLAQSDLEILNNENDVYQIVMHPNVMRVFKSFIQVQFLYTVFPYSPYPSVDILSKPFGLDEKIIVYVLKDMLNAISYLHKNDIIHRAIKGSHVLVFGDQQSGIKFVLSGLKYCYQMSSENTELKVFEYPKNASNILNHLPPEIIEQNILGYNFKADIYMLGVLTCELANGVVPFDNMTSDEILFYKMIGDIPRILDSSCEEMIIFNEYFDRLELSLKNRYKFYCKRKFSPSLHDFTSKCMHIEPTQRPTTLDLMCHQLITSMDVNYQKRNDFLSEWLEKTINKN